MASLPCARIGYFGGAAPCIVPDNAKVAVASHPKEGEVVVNDAYREMAAHYGAAVMPTRVRPRRFLFTYSTTCGCTNDFPRVYARANSLLRVRG